MIEPQPRKIRRQESLALSAVLTAGLASYMTSDTNSVVSVLTVLLILAPLAGSIWVLQIDLATSRRDLSIYALFILPWVLYTNLLFLLRSVGIGLFAWVAVGMALPTFYVLYISLSALDLYRLLPTHVARVILNVLTLVTGFLSATLLLKLALPLWLGITLCFLLFNIIMFQGIIWWSNANLPYALFYSALAALLLALLYWTLSFWPVGYLITGFTMMIGLYLLMGIIQNYFKKTLTTQIVVEHVIISLISLSFIFMQINWLPELA